MPETPPPISPTPTASPDDQELDQAATPAVFGVASFDQPATIPGIQFKQADSKSVSHTAPMNAQQAATQPQAATASTNEAGNVPNASPAVRDGPGRPLLSPTGQPLARGPDGRLYNPAKGEPQPKAQSSALLNSPKPLQAKDINSGGFPEGGNTDSGISGLDAIPKGWPKLPSNASLAQEIGWVQSERLLVVKETPGRRTKVDLSKASVPAPSMSALGWLETSIRSYAKFIEVASKTASQANDEAEFVRRERMAIGEIDALLKEMYDAEG